MGSPMSETRRDRSLRRARNGSRSILAVLQRLIPVARRLLGAVKALALASLLSIAVIVAVVLAHGVPDVPTAAVLVVVVAVLAPAPVLLWLFHGALREALALPEWLRSSPEMAKGHVAELGDLVAESRRSPTGRRGGIVRDSVRAGRLLLEAHDDLPGYGAVLRLVSPVFLLACAIAVVVAVVEVGLAASVVAVDLTFRVLG